MMIAMDFYEPVASSWNGIDIDVFDTPEGERVLVCDVPECCNLNAPVKCVEHLLKKKGVFENATRADVVDAILEWRGWSC